MCIRDRFGNDPLDLSGYVLTQANSAQTFTLPAGTLIPPGGYVIVARNVEKAAFESAWSVSLADNVVFVNSGGKVPQINGDETYTLSDAASVSYTHLDVYKRQCHAGGVSADWRRGHRCDGSFGHDDQQSSGAPQKQ